MTRLNDHQKRIAERAFNFAPRGDKEQILNAVYDACEAVVDHLCEGTAARAFTEQREREIAEVQEEIRLLEFMFRFACVVPAEHEVYGRIISREQAALAELRRGMKEGSE